MRPGVRVRRTIGAPLARNFSDVLACDDEVMIDRAVAAYRGRFNAVGIFENALYPQPARNRLRRGHQGLLYVAGLVA